MDDLAKEIAKALTEYSDEVAEIMEQEKSEVAKEGVKQLKATSPKRNGSYAKGWRVKKNGKGYIIHNAKHYRLTHLLENGHATRNGGRTKAIPHIAKVESNIIERFTKNIEKRL